MTNGSFSWRTARSLLVSGQLYCRLLLVHNHACRMITIMSHYHMSHDHMNNNHQVWQHTASSPESSLTWQLDACLHCHLLGWPIACALLQLVLHWISGQPAVNLYMYSIQYKESLWLLNPRIWRDFREISRPILPTKIWDNQIVHAGRMMVNYTRTDACTMPVHSVCRCNWWQRLIRQVTRNIHGH